MASCERLTLEEFADNLADGIEHLHDDLDRFIFLLGGSEASSSAPATTTSPAKEARRQRTG